MDDTVAVRIKDLKLQLDGQRRPILELKECWVFNRPGLTAIVGESGAGKTTLINILLGQLRNYTGTIEVMGVRLETLHSDSERQMYLRQIGVIPQKPKLFPDWTVERN